jgi:pyruvate/2-oxoglutarate/acetoin dehydrogenase E1 component
MLGGEYDRTRSVRTGHLAVAQYADDAESGFSPPWHEWAQRSVDELTAPVVRVVPADGASRIPDERESAFLPKVESARSKDPRDRRWATRTLLQPA